jgi:uncharacterized protein
MAELAPVAPRERVLALDVLRGFALLGVLIGNMVLYSGRWTEHGTSSTTLDEIVEWFQMLFVDSKAQTLLTLLFGFGFAVQLIRAQERGHPVLGVYTRRLLVLLLFGALHILLLWWGDVIWTYAVAGFGLLVFLRASNRTRLVFALAFTFVPYLLLRSIPEVFVGAMRLFIEPRHFPAYTADMARAIHTAGHASLARAHATYALVWATRIYAWYFLWVLGRFLLGLIAGQLRWFDSDGAGHLAVFRRLAIWCGAFAVAASAVRVLERLQIIALADQGVPGRLVSATVDQVALLSMTLTYVAAVVLVIQRPAARRLLRVLSPLGRMTLTTYIAQSVICTFIFYGWGLGLAGRISVAGCFGLALAIFAVQVVLSTVWLRYFRFGPLEWLLRSLVYLKRQPMRL